MSNNGKQTLTPREIQILQLLARGNTRDKIAKMLDVRPGTMKSHIENILRKLHLHNQLELVAYAYSHQVAIPTHRQSMACPNCGAQLVLQPMGVDNANSAITTR